MLTSAPVSTRKQRPVLQSVEKNRGGELPITLMTTLLLMVGQDSGADERLGESDKEEIALELPVLARAS